MSVQVPKRERGRRRATHERRALAWLTLGHKGYCGWRICVGCGKFAYCRAHRYDRPRCEQCYMRGQ